MVYAEVGNLGDYLKDKDAGKEMHFSINGGEWCRGFSWWESEENPGNCIYAFLSTKSEEEKITEYLTEGEVLHIQPGTTINVSARTPENYYYKPSAESEQKFPQCADCFCGNKTRTFFRLAFPHRQRTESPKNQRLG